MSTYSSTSISLKQPVVNPTTTLPSSHEEIPNQETNKTIDIQWSFINNIALDWHKNQAQHVSEKHCNSKEFWGNFASDGHKSLLLPVLRDFLGRTNGTGKLAIDLGCGNSPATSRLLKKGWQVIAVDYSRLALDVLVHKYPAAIASGQLRIIEADIAEFSSPEPADLVIAADCFPYTDPSLFQITWNKIHGFLIKKNGFLIGSFYVMRTTSDPGHIQMVNRAKAFGSWFLPNWKVVNTLLENTGYHVKQFEFRDDLWLRKPVCIQFVARKK